MSTNTLSLTLSRNPVAVLAAVIGLMFSYFITIAVKFAIFILAIDLALWLVGQISQLITKVKIRLRIRKLMKQGKMSRVDATKETLKENH